MNQPLVSVIVPVYKVEPYLRQCLDSVVGQTYRNLEILLIDDGSPDTCGQICEEYAASDARIRVIHQKNQGLSGARNTGMDVATGAYLMFVDSDDWIDLTLTEKLVERSLATDADLVQCRVNYTYEDGRQEKARIFGPDNLESLEINEQNREEVNYRWVLGDYIWDCAWGRLYRRALVEHMTLRYVDTKLVCNEDFLFTLCLFSELRRLEIVQEVLYFYRQRGDSLTQASSYPHRIACRPRLAKEFENYLRRAKAPGKLRRHLANAVMAWLMRGDYFDLEAMTVPEAKERCAAALAARRKQGTFRRQVRRAAFSRGLGIYIRTHGKGAASVLHNRILVLCFAYGGLDIYMRVAKRFAPGLITK